MWIKIRNLIISITKNSVDYNYDQKNTKIKFDSVDEPPLNKSIEIPTITVVVNYFFENKFSLMNVGIKF